MDNKPNDGGDFMSKPDNLFKLSLAEQKLIAGKNKLDPTFKKRAKKVVTQLDKAKKTISKIDEMSEYEVYKTLSKYITPEVAEKINKLQ